MCIRDSQGDGSPRLPGGRLHQERTSDQVRHAGDHRAPAVFIAPQKIVGQQQALPTEEVFKFHEDSPLKSSGFCLFQDVEQPGLIPGIDGG